MARPARPERSRSARSSRQLSRFYHSINLDRVFGTHSPTWKLGAVSISILRRQFDKTYVAVAFKNNGRAVTLNFILVNGPDGWVIADVESPQVSLRMFLAQYKN